MPSHPRRRRRFPTIALLAGLTLLVVSPLGWAWLQHDLYREEERVVAELKESGVDVSAERGAFVAQERGDQAEGTLGIMTEQWRSAVDETFPWLRPLREVHVHVPTSVEQANRVATLPRVQHVTFSPPPGGVPSAASDVDMGIDRAALSTISLVAEDLDEPLPTGKTLLGEDLRKFERELGEAWAGRGSEPISDRFAVTIGEGSGWLVTRLSVDGARRKLVHRWPEKIDVSVRTDGVWRSATRDYQPAEGLGLQTLPPEGPYFHAHYESYPPYVQPEFPAYGEPYAPPSTLLSAGIERVEKLDDDRYLVRFRSFQTTAMTTNGVGRSTDETGHAVGVESVALIVRPDLDWCVERGEADFSETRRIEWMNQLERKGDAVVVREQLYRPSDTSANGFRDLGQQASRTAFLWNLAPKFAEEEFTLADAGAGSLGPPRTIPLYRRWYLATAAVGALLTAYALLRIVARRALLRQQARTAAATQSEATAV